MKREREEAAVAASNKGTETLEKTEPQLLNPRINTSLPVLPTAKKDQSSSGSEESSDESDNEPTPAKRPTIFSKPLTEEFPTSEIDADGNLLLRKKSKAFLQNGKVCRKKVLKTILFYKFLKFILD